MNRYHLVAPALAVFMATGLAVAASSVARAAPDITGGPLVRAIYAKTSVAQQKQKLSQDAYATYRDITAARAEILDAQIGKAKRSLADAAAMLQKLALNAREISVRTTMSDGADKPLTTHWVRADRTVDVNKRPDSTGVRLTSSRLLMPIEPTMEDVDGAIAMIGHGRTVEASALLNKAEAGFKWHEASVLKTPKGRSIG